MTTDPAWARHLSVESVRLERLKVGAQIAVSREATLSVEPDVLRDQLVMRLESTVLADRLVGDTKSVTRSIDFPTSPWQFFKQNHAQSWWLGWLVQRRPVATRPHPVNLTVTFERYATYPKNRMLLPEMGAPVTFERFL